jgi:hypothetical protein
MSAASFPIRARNRGRILDRTQARSPVPRQVRILGRRPGRTRDRIPDLNQVPNPDLNQALNPVRTQARSRVPSLVAVLAKATSSRFSRT